MTFFWLGLLLGLLLATYGWIGFAFYLRGVALDEARMFVENEVRYSNRADESMKILDRGELVVLFRNINDCYSAASFCRGQSLFEEIAFQIGDRGFTSQVAFGDAPSNALHALSEKRLGTGVFR